MRIYLFALAFAGGVLGTPQQGAYLSQDGNLVSYVPPIQGVGISVGNAPTNDHQRATALFASSTSDDGHSQESTVGIETAVTTGYNEVWIPNHLFKARSNIYVPRDKTSNGTYRQVSNRQCQSGIVQPAGFGDKAQRQTDGTCVWQWIKLPNIFAKAGLYSEELVSSGAGNTWNLALNTLLKEGTPLAFHTNAELDFGNDAQECFGSSNCINLEVKTGGKFRSTHGILVDSDNSGKTYATHFGLRLAGAKLSSDVDIESDASGLIGIGICSTGFITCSHSTASIQDKSRAPIGIELAGSYSKYAITSYGFQVDSSGGVTSAGYMSARRFSSALYTPPSSKSTCAVGEYVDDSNYHYVCTSPNKWKRILLSDF